MSRLEDRYVTIDQLCRLQGRRATLSGWVRRVRSSGKVLFIVVRDGSGICQGVLEKNQTKQELFATLAHVGQESVVELTGTVRADERAPGGYELAIEDGKLLHLTRNYPISPKPHGPDFLLTHRHLWLRAPRQSTIMRIRDTLVWSIREYFRREGFVLIDTPIFSPSAGEGSATLFKVDYFDEPVYLAQTGQLYLEAAASSLRKVYSFGPTFRAEKSKTRRHLTEFWMVEPEVAFVDLDGLLELAEDFVCYIVRSVLERHREDLETLGRNCSALEQVKRPFFRLKYDEAVDLLHGEKTERLIESEQRDLQKQINAAAGQLHELERRAGEAKKAWQKDKLAGQIVELREQLAELREQLKNIPEHRALAKNFAWGQDLGGSDETIISKLHDRPVFVTHYPSQAKAFYMRQDRNRPEVVENFDLLACEGYGEVIGGSVREEDIDRLTEKMREQQLPLEPYQWYLDLRRYGSVPHGGFGLGVERTLAWICGLKHIREAIAFPRLMGRIYP